MTVIIKCDNCKYREVKRNIQSRTYNILPRKRRMCPNCSKGGLFAISEEIEKTLKTIFSQSFLKFPTIELLKRIDSNQEDVQDFVLQNRPLLRLINLFFEILEVANKGQINILLSYENIIQKYKQKLKIDRKKTKRKHKKVPNHMKEAESFFMRWNFLVKRFAYILLRKILNNKEDMINFSLGDPVDNLLIWEENIFNIIEIVNKGGNKILNELEKEVQNNLLFSTNISPKEIIDFYELTIPLSEEELSKVVESILILKESKKQKTIRKSFNRIIKLSKKQYSIKEGKNIIYIKKEKNNKETLLYNKSLKQFQITEQKNIHKRKENKIKKKKSEKFHYLKMRELNSGKIFPQTFIINNNDKDNDNDEYSILQEIGYNKGRYEIWYADHTSNPETNWFRWEMCVENGTLELPKKYEDLKESHIKLGSVDMDFKEIFHKLQGHNWKGKTEESNKLLKDIDVKHTSMSVGDIIYDTDKSIAYILKSIGYKKIKF